MAGCLIHTSPCHPVEVLRPCASTALSQFRPCQHEPDEHTTLSAAKRQRAAMADRLAPSTRHQYLHQGRVVYEWDQTLSEVNIYVEAPPGVRAKDMFCKIEPRHVSFGLQGNPPFMDLDLAGAAKVSESFWTLEDGTFHITLAKLEEGETWPSAIAGHVLDPLAQQKEQERIMLERFQREHPGFDFSGATFNGQVPNARTFMGGMQQS